MILRLPGDKKQTFARDMAQERVQFLSGRLDELYREEADSSGPAEDDLREEVADTRADLEDAEADLRALQAQLGGWKDGHGFYDANSDYDNPIARVRFDIRTSRDGTRTMFIQEVQVPKDDQPMPAELRKHGPAIGFSGPCATRPRTTSIASP